MATNLDLDQNLLTEAVAVGGHRSKKAAVTEALKEYIARRRQKEVIEMFGTVVYEEGYDYRKRRRRP